MRVFLWSMLVGLLIWGQAVHADEIAVINAPVRIPVGQTKEFEFGTVPQKNTTVLLKITSRMDATGLGGSNFFLRIRLNGHDVQAAKSRTAMRLVNKPVISLVTPEVPSTWYGDTAGWRALYAPDFTAALAQKFYVGNPYELVLDVTDLTNPMSENRLEITNTANPGTKKYSGTDADLVIGSLSVETKPVPSVMMSEVGNMPAVVNHGEPAAGASAYHGALLPGGGFAMRVGKNTFKFNSAFSYPNAGFNHFSADGNNAANQPGWQVKTDAKTNRAVAQGADYRVVRTIKWEKNHAEIIDSITNLHLNAPLGLAVRNEMDLSGLRGPEVRLAGNPDPAMNDNYAPGNPSVHVRLPNSGIGVIAEDDVFRNQALLYTNPGTQDAPPVAGIRTEMLRLAPGETYALRWAVYPVAGPDYFDFVNLVRADWGANFTVLGGWWWGFSPDWVLQLPLPQLHDLLAKNGIRYATIGGGWVDRLHDVHHIGFGTGVFDDYWADYRRRVREAGDKLRQALPGIKVMAYFDTQRDTSENSSQKFPDSWLTDSNGKQLYTDWNNLYSRSFSMAPTLQNSFGKAMVADAGRYLTDMKLDGIYWDEMENTGYGEPLISYSNFDGHSCLLDHKTWTIQHEVSITALAGLPFRMAVIHEVQAKGGVLLGNGPTGMIDELRTGVQRMIEIQHNDSWSYLGNLETPLGYISGNVDWPNFLRAFNQAMLPVSSLGDKGFPHDITPYLFPFTPIELHPGYLLGRERIVVTHDGDYGWNGERVLSFTHHFDAKGKLTATHFPINITARGARSSVKLAENEAAVLERVPVSFSPAAKVMASKTLAAKWKATVTVTQYDADAVTLQVNAPQGGVLETQSGGKAVIKAGFNGQYQLRLHR